MNNARVKWTICWNLADAFPLSACARYLRGVNGPSKCWVSLEPVNYSGQPHHNYLLATLGSTCRNLHDRRAITDLRHQ